MKLLPTILSMRTALSPARTAAIGTRTDGATIKCDATLTVCA